MMEAPRRVADSESVEDLVARLERERLEADRLYNDALTAVDRAIQTLPALPDAPPPFDQSRLRDLNATWNILPSGAPTIDRSLRGRLRGLVWRLVGPPLESQVRFNAALVDHLNRNVGPQSQASVAVAGVLDAIRNELDALIRFQSRLVQYLQTITAYVDSKDRSLGGSELRERLALTEQRLLTLKRYVETNVENRGRDEFSNRENRPDPISGPGAPSDAAFGGAVDSLTYVAFENAFRGSPEEIRRRVEDYVPLLVQASDVVDLGCGRGELLSALRDHQVRARGIDVNHAMVELCRSRGLDVEEADALEFLRRQQDESVGGLVAIQVVEHFSPRYLVKVLETSFHKMRPGAPLVLETINPACWMAFFETFIRDVTHAQPLHPETLRYLVQGSGFTQVDVQFRQPVREKDRLVRASEGSDMPGPFRQLVDVINDHADKLNTRLFSYMDYVVVARR
jgi:2-polyprenyl-3-methyl-5-hydroxy-6-metoxy-1,4-benzoquinol methylase